MKNVPLILYIYLTSFVVCFHSFNFFPWS